MRKINGIENVDKMAFDMATSEVRTQCNKEAGAACKATLAAKLSTLTLQGKVSIREHGNRRIYEAALMVGTLEEHEKEMKMARMEGQRFGERIGIERGLWAGREEGHRSGKHAAEADFRRLPLWRKVYHHFAGF
jgi:flagellar biosynthesis/type III secretory pathway protein FliH